MRTRPRTKFVKKLKSRRCTKCNSKMSLGQVRCRRCASAQTAPKKGRYASA